MPIHDWSNVPPGLFHHFHQNWTVEICDNLNDGRLPDGHYALVEQRAVGLVQDVLTLRERQRQDDPLPLTGGGLAVADAPPKAWLVSRAEDEELYATRANRVAVRAADAHLVAVIEIISPGNKANKQALHALVSKSLEFLQQGVNLLLVDLLPPSPRNPQGIHPLIWSEVREEPFVLPPGRPLTLAAYAAGPPPTAYVEPVAVGQPLPDMPVFLDADTYVPLALEATYAETWRHCPRQYKEQVSPG